MNTSSPFKIHRWQRDSRNPVLPSGASDFDFNACMTPFGIREGEEYYLFYGGGSNNGRQICLATCPVHDITNWTRLGPLFPTGGPDDFDAFWAVLPCVHRFGSKWHLYYTGRNPKLGDGLQSFTGIGLATSTDLRNWTRYANGPVLRGDGFDRWPGNQGIAGGGNIIEIPQPDGRILYRMYYTLAVGSKNVDVRIDQEKHSVVAHSYDGIEWFDRRVVLSPREEATYENIAVIGLTVWQEKDGWRGIYAGIGTQFGYYSLCEASSADGLNWLRGEPGENLTLPPQGDGWEKQMTEYPSILVEAERLRLFYCGNGYGSTGIGTAVADKLDTDISSRLTDVFKSLERGQRQTVVLYGTSLTKSGEWANAMKRWFNESYPNQVTFVNSAQNGADSNFGVGSLDSRVLAHRPDLVLMEFSFNDAIEDRHLSPEQSWNNLDQMVSSIREQNPNAAIAIQVMNVAWDPRPDQLSFTRRANLETYNENYRRYACEVGIPLLDHYPNWFLLQERENEKYRAYVPDGGHPTAEGSLVVTWPAVKALLEAARASAVC